MYLWKEGCSRHARGPHKILIQELYSGCTPHPIPPKPEAKLSIGMYERRDNRELRNVLLLYIIKGAFIQIVHQDNVFKLLYIRKQCTECSASLLPDNCTNLQLNPNKATYENNQHLTDQWICQWLAEDEMPFIIAMDGSVKWRPSISWHHWMRWKAVPVQNFLDTQKMGKHKTCIILQKQ